MPGLVPGIHVLKHTNKLKNMDDRDKPGDDEVTWLHGERQMKMGSRVYPALQAASDRTVHIFGCDC
jgi:hypothetical protein